MLTRCLLVGFLAATPAATALAAQQLNVRERAKAPYEAGLEQMRNEAFDAAMKSFQSAISIDPEFEMAHYMLGRVHMAQRNYVSAVYALTKARDVFRAQGTQQFTNKQEAVQKRRDLINDMTNVISQLQLAAQTPQVQEQIRQYTERKRQVEDMDREAGLLSPDKAVPGFVSLSLGSAYHRTGKLSDAEQEYLAAVATDPKIGEAHNNLAVIYLQTGRLDEAEKAVKAAEKAGLRVNPALKDEIKKRKKAGTR